jgi:hypothetical protein
MSGYWVVTHENETPIEIHRKLFAFHGEDTVNVSTMCCWVRKSEDSGGNFDPNDQPRCGRSVTTTHDLNRRIIVELIQKNRRISQRAVAEKLNNGLIRVNEIIAGSGYDQCHNFSGNSELPISCSTFFLHTEISTIWLLALFRSQGTSHNLKIIHFTCDKVQAATWKWFREES